MTRPIRPEEELRLADRLRSEADASRPPFSEGLHARICQAIEHREPPALRRPAPQPRRRWLSLVMAATLLIGVSVAAWWLAARAGPAPQESRQEVFMAAAPDPVATPDIIAAPPGEALEQFSMLVDSTLATGQWAYLDQDARMAAQLLINQLPFDVASIE